MLPYDIYHDRAIELFCLSESRFIEIHSYVCSFVATIAKESIHQRLLHIQLSCNERGERRVKMFAASYNAHEKGDVLQLICVKDAEVVIKDSCATSFHIAARSCCIMTFSIAIRKYYDQTRFLLSPERI